LSTLLALLEQQQQARWLARQFELQVQPLLLLLLLSWQRQPSLQIPSWSPKKHR
jgi:hypothetical protein